MVQIVFRNSYARVSNLDLDKTGRLLDCVAGPKEFAEAIIRLLRNEQDYHRLSQGARRHYESHGNWRTSVNRLVNEIKPFVSAA